MALVKMQAKNLRLGQPFAITSDGKFADVFGDWDYGPTVPEINPVTGEHTGRTVRTLTYVGVGGYRDQILRDAVVYADPEWSPQDKSPLSL